MQPIDTEIVAETENANAIEIEIETRTETKTRTTETKKRTETKIKIKSKIKKKTGIKTETEIETGIIIKPTIRNFSAVDLILTPNCIFQITVSPKHPVKQSGLINIVQNMLAYRKNPNAKFFLYFIVPDDIYDTFRYQSYVTPKKKIGNDLEAFQAVKRKSPILRNVEQWGRKN